MFTRRRGKFSAGRVGLLAAALIVGLQLLWVGTEAGAQQQSCDDHCDALDNTATDLSLGTALDGNLEATGDIDVFEFTVPAGDTKDVWIYATGDTDTFGILLDGTGSLSDVSKWLAFSNDGFLAADSNFGFGANVGPGTYYVVVAGADPETTTGRYSLQSQDLSSTTTLTLGADQSGNLDPGGEVAVFEFEIAASDGATDVWLYTTGSTDTVGFLSDDTGVLADFSTALELGNDSALADGDNFYLGANLDPGTYYVTVAGADGDAGTYTLKSRKGTDHADEFSASLTPLSPGTPVAGIVGPAGDADVFKLDIAGETDVVLYSEGDLDTVGTLLDADGDYVAGNDDSAYAAVELNFLLARTLEAGVYYIEVTGYGAGPYRLHYREIGDQSNTRSSAESVTLDSPDLTMGFISGEGDADYFSFTPSSAGVFRVYTLGATDTVGDLQDGEGTSRGENNDGRLSPGHRGFLIERTLSTGVHYISVTGWEDETGPYRLVVVEVTDPGDTTANAAELTPGAVEIGAIGSGGDKDMFKLELDAETEVVLYSNGPTDTKAELLDSNGDSLSPKVEDDDGGEGFNFLIHATLASGTHYIRVEGFSANTTGSYALFAEPVVPVAVFPGLDGEHAVGRIRTGHDQGFHKFTLATRAPIWIYTTGLVDTYGTLYDSNFNEIASNDDAGLVGISGQFSIRETLGAGTYYVRVSSYGTGTGGYALHVHAVDEPGSSRESANDLGLGVPTPGVIDSENDEDYFRFQFNEATHNYGSETYFLLDVISSGEVSVEGEIQSSDGSRIEVNAYSYTDGFILAENFGSGTYYVKVTAPSGPTPYTVILLPHSRYANLASNCAEETDKLRHPQTDARLFGDPYYACQWHLKNREPLQLGQDINIEAAWATTVNGRPVNGEGVNVVVVDDGMDWRHEDLRPNVEASRNHDYGGGNDIYHSDEHHGTAVSGVLAARDNSIGVRGVAPRATIHGHNFLSAQSAFSEADSMVRNGEVTAVSNNSWGPVAVLGFAESFWELAVEKGIREGYGGKGTFYVFAAGNGALDGDDANLDEFANFYAVTSACGVNDRGTRTNFSVKGSSLWVCAAAGDTRDGYRGLVTTDNSDRYRNRTHGTSFSAPIVSGVAALLRQVEPDLTWRDLKLILAGSAQKNDPGNGGWDDGALKYGSTTERYHFNHEYGFGMVDAKAAVDLAQNWDLLAPFQEKQADGTLTPGPKQIPDDSTTAREYTATVTDSGMSFIEFVEVKARFQHTSFRDLDIELMSPAGEVSKLVTHDESQELVSLTAEIRLGSSKHLGEAPDGTWTLKVTDKLNNGKSGTLEAWEITVYGHSPTPGTPRAVSVTPGPERLTVTWEEPQVTRGAITGYDIRYTPTDGGDAVIAENLQFGSDDPLSYEITGLDPRTEYSVEILARNSAGEGPWSQAVRATTEGSGGTDCSTGTVLQGISASQELTDDCTKLLSVRATLEGQGSLNWSTGLAFANWDGVVSGAPAGETTLRVTGLDLIGEGLTGHIPAEIGDLTGLETLDLSDNDLTGSIPSRLGELTTLRELVLSGNQLSGDIPSELGNLGALETLDLSDNGLSGRIPEALGEQDTSSPPQTKLGGLTTLRLKANQLSEEIPAVLGNLTTLEELDLSNNSLTGTIPTELSGLTSLDTLFLAGNQLSGEIPSDVITMSGLERVDLSDNQLTTGTDGLPTPATTASSLVYLNLSNNRLSGGIPAGLSNWAGLEELRLADNSFSGDMPAGLSWGSFSQLSLLDLGDNDLTGAIPPGMRALGTLQKLHLDGNRFEEDISGWGNSLASLEELFLAQDGETLTGCIPGGLRSVAKNDLPDLKLPYCDLFLTGLTVEGATLDPAFDPADRERTNYQAVAGLARVTIAPTGEPGVSFTYRDETDEEAPDVDPDEPEHQVDLGTGATVVKIVAASADGKAERVYQITFRRAGEPGTPTIDPASGVTAGEGQLTVAWTAPSYNGGWDIVSYDLRYIERDARDRVRSDWKVLEKVWETSSGGPLEATIDLLVGGVEYSVQVRAFNGSQFSGWSSIVRGTPGAAACGSGAIMDPANNRELAVDCGVLLAIRDALAGTNGSVPNWSENTPIGNWDGIETAQAGTAQRVAKLELPGAGLDGRIPPTIGRLTGLATLDLSDNNLAGPIPRQMGDLARLTVLNLGDDPGTEDGRNQLAGTIPPTLGRLSRLVTLDLSGNSLNGRIPSYLVNPSGLATVDLSGNDLEGRIPSSFSRRDFVSLDLSGNELSGNIPTLRVLGTLDLSDNQLTGGIPTLGGSMGPTMLLDLSNNELTGSIPHTWGAVSGTPPTRKLGTLEVLRLDGNQLSGDIPANLNGMTALTELDLGGNGLSGSIPFLGSLSGLTKLHLNDNGLAGVFPTWLPGLTFLVEVDLSGNGLTGEIPSELGDLTGLKVLALSDNQLSGRISGKLAVSTLEKLLLGGNDLTGEIPPEVAGLQNLTHLNLSDNGLSGEVPTAWGSTTALEELLLHGNGLTGEIPPGLTSLAGLKVLNLGDNGLDGGIPMGWSSSSSLEIVDLHDNGLTGPIPTDLGNLAELKELRLSENQLSGPIPAGLGSLTNLEQLWLGDNSLTGEIPTELGGLTKLKAMDLHHNALTGPIPSSFGNLTNLQILLLPFNDLTGEPPDLGALSDLRWLYLFFNRFTGGIPEWIESLEKLSRLHLDDNEFDGTIPAWLADLPLSQLYLYGNNLSGCVPKELEPLSREIENDLRVLGLPFCPDTPSRPSVTSSSSQLTVLLDVPSDPDEIIDHLEVRYIRHDSPGKANDANWTVERMIPATADNAGPTSHTITGLTDGVQYDIQARWVAGNGQESPWSPTLVAAPGIPPSDTDTDPEVELPPEQQLPPPEPRRGGGGGGGGSPIPAVLPLPEVSARTLEFTAFVGGEDLPPRLLHLWSPSGTPMTFNVSSNVPWLVVQPTSGSSSGPLERMEVAVSVDASQLQPGRHPALIRISGTGFRDSPIEVGVQVTVTSAEFAGSLAPQYDANNNLSIELDEARRAVTHYFEERIGLEDVLKVVKLYFAG